MERRAAREEAFKLLFSLDINDECIKETALEDAFLISLVQGVLTNKESLDNAISEQLTNWTINRIAAVEKTILRIALFEIQYLDDIPAAVSINEAVDLAHKYGDDTSGKFINGVLAKHI